MEKVKPAIAITGSKSETLFPNKAFQPSVYCWISLDARGFCEYTR